MTFMRGKLCELRVLDENDDTLVRQYAHGVNAGLTTEHLFTGSYPMRAIDFREVFRKEREAGSVMFWVYMIDGPKPMPTPGPWPSEAIEAFSRTRYTFIGTVGLHSHRDIYASWEARWLIFDPTAVGKGIGTEAGIMLTDYAFRRLNAHRVWLGVSAENERAVKCYQKIGYKEESRLCDEIYAYGRYHDAIRMGMLRPEWIEKCKDWGVPTEGRVDWASILSAR